MKKRLKKVKETNKKKSESINEPVLSPNEKEEEEFKTFFSETMTNMPETMQATILNSYQQSKEQADKIWVKSQKQLTGVFDEFLTGVPDATRKKAHQTIHAASLTAAIIGCSPIPFSDAMLLVPVQLTMMARLHKLFGQSWTESLGKSVGKEMVMVGLGRSVVGNVLKLFPAVGTVAGGVINATVASSLTETLGWVTVKMLNDGEDIFEQAMSFKGQFQMLFDAVKKAKKK